jgi:hypothetical protein
LHKDETDGPVPSLAEAAAITKARPLKNPQFCFSLRTVMILIT